MHFSFVLDENTIVFARIISELLILVIIDIFKEKKNPKKQNNQNKTTHACRQLMLDPLTKAYLMLLT